MARNFYRLYLYSIFSTLVVFIVTVTAHLLNTGLLFTPLRGSYMTPPSQAEVIQAVVFTTVGWLIAGTLGGLHYWLIRRDMREHPETASNAIRAFFLNGVEAVGIAIGVLSIGFALLSWASSSDNDITAGLASGIPTLLMVLLLELERRRASAQTTLALVFQRLHFFGIQLFFLIVLLNVLLTNLQTFIDGLFFGGKETYINCNGQCAAYDIGLIGLALLWFLAFWLLYCLITNRDNSRITRLIMHGIGMAIGVGLLIEGLYTGIELLLLPLFNASAGLVDILGPGAHYDFITPLIAGLLTTGVYHLLLRNASQRELVTARTRQTIEWTITALLLAGTFWGACAYGLRNVLVALSHLPEGPDNLTWVSSVALLIATLGYIPLDLYLRKQYGSASEANVVIRRAYILTLLGEGIPAFAIGTVLALYAWITALLGSPIDNWPQTAYTGLAVGVVGLIISTIYLWTQWHEHLFARQTPTPPSPTPETPAPETPTTPEPATIESILDDLLAGRISRDEAEERIRQINTTPHATSLS